MRRRFTFFKIRGRWLSAEEAEKAYGLESLPYLIEDVAEIDIVLESISGRGRS